MRQWVEDNSWVWWPLIGLTILSLLTAVVAVPWALAKMSPDYFMPDRDPRRSFANLHPVLRWSGLVLKNALGVVLVAMGILFLLTPGQGLLTILVGLILVNFPGKRALELWIIRFPLVLKAANWLRARRGQAPLQVPARS